MRKYLCYLFQKGSSTSPLVHLKKTASFRTQLSTYSRRFITSVEHENSGEHEISDLSTDLSLSSSTVYNLGPWTMLMTSACFQVGRETSKRRQTETAQKLGLKVNTSKTKLMKMNHKSNDPFTMNYSDIDEVNELTYLWSKLATNQSFAMLKHIWKSKRIGTNTKLRIFNSHVLSVLLYGAQCFKLTIRIAHKIHTFQNKCLRKILRIVWPR